MSFFDTLLVPIDFSSHSTKALDYAIALVKTFGGSIHLLHAYRLPFYIPTLNYPNLGRDFWSAVRDSAGRKLEEGLQKIAAAGIEEGVDLSEMPPAQAITETAERIGADLIVMGTRGLTGLKHVLLGSVAERTIRMAPCPVMTVKDTLQVTEPARLRTILIPIDFSECSHRALALARSLARAARPAHLILIHAYFLPLESEMLAEQVRETLLKTVSQRAAERLERMLVEVQDDGVSADFVGYPGRPESVIVDVASDQDADLIVMGTHGQSGLAHVLVGSVAERVLRTAPCPVITVKAPEK